MTRVKICGIMNERDIGICTEAGVSVLGFVVDYPVPVPWNLTPERARELIACVPPFIQTCVVTGGSVKKILEIADFTRPNLVQLHYRESLGEIAETVRCLKPNGIKTIKALRINRDGRCDFEISDPAIAARTLSDSGISAILADSYTEAMPGGTGVTLDLSTFLSIKKESSLPVILAGGLNPSNIESIIHETQPYAVDLLTGTEERPGFKDPDKVNRIMAAIAKR
ncbi:MAG TPA: phosphoribosylanthranilate isomerase [Clostridia bacterium]|nr:phosphoribosylanthranilate isomerase [Clostridia bacterium]